MARPSFQFYPDDWLTDIGLRGCSPSARGVWVDMLCMMHQGTPYGHFSDAAGALPVKLGASRCGVTVKMMVTVIAELEAHKVFSRTDDGIIFSRRMVRDEHNRNARAKGGHSSHKHPSVPRSKGILPNEKKDILLVEEGEEEVLVTTTTKPTTPKNGNHAQYDPMPGWTKFKLNYPEHRINEYMDLRLWISIVDSAATEKKVLAGLKAHKASELWKKGCIHQASRFLGERIFDVPVSAEESEERPRLMMK